MNDHKQARRKIELVELGREQEELTVEQAAATQGGAL
jgi:hypothetical protein